MRTLQTYPGQVIAPSELQLACLYHPTMRKTHHTEPTDQSKRDKSNQERHKGVSGPTWDMCKYIKGD